MACFSRAALAVALVVACACGGSSPTSPEACAGRSLTAVGGPDRSTAKHVAVQLDGSASGARGDVSYIWRLNAIPPGSNASLSTPNTAHAAFTTDQSGVYVASLVVQDSCGASAPATTVITVVNRPPVASGGPDLHAAAPGVPLTLDGSASSDPDQDAISFEWSLVSKPPNSSAVLSSASAKAPTLLPDQFGTYVVTLAVSDGATTSTPVAVVVKVGVTGPSGNCTPAAAPVASAGADQSISFAGSIRLDGTQSTSGRGGALTYRWSVTSSPAGSTPSFDNPASPQPFVFVSRSGVYVVTLVVNDGCVDSAPATVKLTRINNPPFANIFSFFSGVPILVPVVLQSSAFDFDGDPITYRWQLVSAPPGSSANFTDVTLPNPGFTPDVPGSYTVSLVVSDGLSSSFPATMTFTAANLPPLALIGPDQQSRVGDTVTLDASGSSDPSHRALIFAWTLQGPPGSTATLTSATTARPSFAPDVTGTYRAQLTVSAGGLDSQASTFVAVWPAVARFAHRVLDAAYSTALDRLVIVATDPNALYIYDPRLHAETTVPLAQAPASVTLSADGLFAVVAHDSAVSHVDLQGAAVVKTLSFVGDIGLAVLGDNAFVYAFPRGPPGDHIRILAEPLAGGTETQVISSFLTGAPRARVRNGAGALYLSSDNAFGFPGIEKYTLGAGTPVLVPPPPFSFVNSCGNLWLSESGTRIFTRCGTVLRASSVPTDDLAPAGSLIRAPNTSLLLRHVSDSTAAGEISAVAGVDTQFFGPDDRTLRRWNADGLSLLESAPLPFEAVGSASFAWNGRFVFYRSDGTERYIMLQLDPAAGVAQDFGVVTF
jgi:chitinase